MADPVFSPEENNALNYHRANLATNNAMRNADGSLTTFKGTIVGTDKGQMLLPTYWHGAVRDVPDAMRFAIRSGIQFPSYKTVEDALAAEQRLHNVMETDVASHLAKGQQ
jgi:hypothetical protein